jgi:hypothetical protein
VDHPVRCDRLDQHELEVLHGSERQGAALASTARPRASSGLLGVKWTSNFGGIIPEAKLAYRHNFGDDIGVDARFVPMLRRAATSAEEQRKKAPSSPVLALPEPSVPTSPAGWYWQFNDE